jgi:N-acetyl sugar amidotransferase
MNKLIYCKKCLYPNTKPHLFLNNEGICNACTSIENKKNINWEKRKDQFLKVVNEYKESSSVHDCVIPVSGGKDSTYQVVKALEYGLNPLCVTASTDSLTEIGRKNIENIKNLGVDYIEVTLNPVIRKKINKFCLETIGDISWPEHVAIFTLPIRVAIQHNIKLIIWGENSQTEYGGPDQDAKKNILDHNWLQEFGGMGALRVDDLHSIDGIEEKNLILYQYPDIEELNQSQIKGIFLGYYFNWDSTTNKEIAEKNGFLSWNKQVEGSYFNFENLDNYHTGIHDYFCFLKFGYGRASAQLSMEIRRNKISRDEALKYTIEHEGKFPTTYLDKSLKDILDDIGVTIDEFIKICDKFTNKKIFQTNLDDSLIKDNNLNLKKFNYNN